MCKNSNKSTHLQKSQLYCLLTSFFHLFSDAKASIEHNLYRNTYGDRKRNLMVFLEDTWKLLNYYPNKSKILKNHTILNRSMCLVRYLNEMTFVLTLLCLSDWFLSFFSSSFFCFTHPAINFFILYCNWLHVICSCLIIIS